MKFNLDALIKEKNISLYSIAKSTKISYTTLHKINNNQSRRVDLDVLQKICDCLKCEIGELLIF